MSSLSSINVISNLEESFFRYFKLKEFDNPDYDPRNNPPEKIFNKRLRLTKTGLNYTLILANWLGKQLSDFKDNFLLGGYRSEYITKKASELHQLLDQVEDVRTRLKTSTLPLIQHIINNELSAKGIERLLKGGHSLTDIVEHCSLEILDYIAEFDPRNTVSDYYNFVKGKIYSTVNGIVRSKIRQEKTKKVDTKKPVPKYIQLSHLDYPYCISWQEFKRKLDAGEYTLDHPHLSLIFENFPPEKLTVLTRRYGLDRRKPESVEELHVRLKKPLSKMERLEIQALTKLGIAIDPEGFRDAYYLGVGSSGLDRKNKILYEYLKAHGLLRWKKYIDYNDGPYSYYLKNYEGVTRGALYKINQGLYTALARRNQLHLVPRERRDYQGNPYQIYLEKYHGTSRGKLKCIDNALYSALWRRNQTHLVPLQTRIQK